MSKLPLRDVEPLFQIISDLDKTEKQSKYRRKSRKDVKNHSVNLRSKSVDGLLEVSKMVERLETELKTKNVQIEKLIGKITTLFECNNNQFAIENEKLQDNFQKVAKNLKELESSLKSCDNCDTLVKENQDLRSDLKMMKILVFRLNVQIERYQEKLKEAKPFEKGAYKENLNWGLVNTHTLAPLLNAYEETISEKDDLIEKFELEIHNFSVRTKKVVEENEALQQEIDCIKASYSAWEEERTRLQAQIDTLRNKAEIQTERADVAKEKLIEVLKCYEQKVQSQCLDIERLQEAYSRSKGELSSIKSMQQNPEQIADSLKKCQHLFEELKSKYDEEKLKMSDEIKELHNELVSKMDEIQELRVNSHDLQSFCERQKEINEILSEKNDALKQNLSQMRQSKEVLKSRLQNLMSWGKGFEAKKEHLKNSIKNVKILQGQVQQKDAQIHAMQIRYAAEIDHMRRKLKQREDSLRRVFEDKISIKQQFSTNL